MSEKKTIKDPAAPKEPIDLARDLLNNRQQAYKQLFGGEGEHIKQVLKDLAGFCRANTSSFHPDQRVHAVLEGRREVWLRIQQHLTLPINELQELYLTQIGGENDR